MNSLFRSVWSASRRSRRCAGSRQQPAGARADRRRGRIRDAWTAEHHTIEFTIAPNPFPILTPGFAHHTDRSGSAPRRWSHPTGTRSALAGEAALCDHLTNGRLEFGIGRGAYQYEFDRMAGGMPQQEGVAYMKEMLPAVKNAVAGRLRARRATTGRFRSATSVPKPAAAAASADLGCGARLPAPSTGRSSRAPTSSRPPLSRPNSEVEILGERFAGGRRRQPGGEAPAFPDAAAHLRLRKRHDGWKAPVEASIEYGRHFENLFKNIGVVRNGFPEPVDFSAIANRNEYEPGFVRENMMFGTPGRGGAEDQVLPGLRRRQLLLRRLVWLAIRGTTPLAPALHSEVMPHFREQAPTKERAAGAARR